MVAGQRRDDAGVNAFCRPRREKAVCAAGLHSIVALLAPCPTATAFSPEAWKYSRLLHRVFPDETDGCIGCRAVRAMADGPTTLCVYAHVRQRACLAGPGRMGAIRHIARTRLVATRPLRLSSWSKRAVAQNKRRRLVHGSCPSFYAVHLAVRPCKDATTAALQQTTETPWSSSTAPSAGVQTDKIRFPSHDGPQPWAGTDGPRAPSDGWCLSRRGFMAMAMED